MIGGFPKDQLQELEKQMKRILAFHKEVTDLVEVVEAMLLAQMEPNKTPVLSVFNHVGSHQGVAIKSCRPKTRLVNKARHSQQK